MPLAYLWFLTDSPLHLYETPVKIKVSNQFTDATCIDNMEILYLLNDPMELTDSCVY